MPRFPLTIGSDTFDDLPALVGDLTARARSGRLDHPGQFHPADHYRAAMDADAGKAVREAIWQACTELVARSIEPAVVLMAAMLCGGCRDAAFFEALLHRLETPDQMLARAPGMQQPSLRDELIRLLVRPFPASDARLHARTVDLFEREGRWEEIVEVLLFADPDDRLLDAVRRATARGSLDYFVVSTLGTIVARDRPALLLDVARALAGQPREHRERFLDRALSFNPAVAKPQEAALRGSLKL